MSNIYIKPLKFINFIVLFKNFISHKLIFNMKTIFTLIITFLFSFNISFAQKVKNETNRSVRLVYHESTPSSKQELRYLLKDDKSAFKIANQKYFELSKSGKILLSTREYVPVKQRIDITESRGVNVSLEEKKFVEKLKENYVLVTDLIDKKWGKP